MKVKLILPALTEARSPYFRPIKYSLFPPLGLATLAAYLDDDDEVEIQDEHVEALNLNDEPALVIIQVYITNAYRAYKIADHYRSRGCYVCLGGIHVTTLPNEAAPHADSLFMGPAEDAWPHFLSDFRAGVPQPVYWSTVRSLEWSPAPRRDLIASEKYLCPNTIVVSRGCPHRCDFCYKESFFKGGKGYYTLPVDRALRQIESMKGRHLFFLDDHLFGNVNFAETLFDGMKGLGKLWQAAATVQSVLEPGLLEKAVDSGLRSLFIGFETLNTPNLRGVHKFHNINRDYHRAIKRLRDHGVMINASFVFGMDHDDSSVFERTSDWAIDQGIETATFHILTPYPGTRLYENMRQQERIISSDWNLYDTRHAVYRPRKMTCAELENGYDRAYENFYSWSNIVKAAEGKAGIRNKLRHLVYTAGWKKFEALWNVAIKTHSLKRAMPLLEAVMAGFGGYANSTPATTRTRNKVVALKRKQVVSA